MISRSNTNENQKLVTGLKWGVGGFLVWNLLRPEARDGIREFLNNVIAANERRQQEIEIHKIIQETCADVFSKFKPSITSLTPTATSATPLATTENLLFHHLRYRCRVYSLSSFLNVTRLG